MEKINKDGAKENIKTEYDDYYGNLVNELVEKKREILTEETLHGLVRKYIQRLCRLTVVYLSGEQGEPLLMYSLGNKIFFRISRFYPAGGFYVEVFNDDVPIVKNFYEQEVVDVAVVKDLILKYLAENDGSKEIIVCSKDDYNWIFKCHYSTDKDGNVDNIDDVKFLETVFEVVRAGDFEEALKKMLAKLSKLETAVTFFDFKFWWNGKFLQMFPAHQIYKKLPLYVKFIKRLDMPSNIFSFTVSL